MPSKIVNKSIEELIDLSLKIGQILIPLNHEKPEIVNGKLLSEIELWKIKWRAGSASLLDADENIFAFCDKDIFPLIHMALLIYGSLPISAATAERSYFYAYWS